MSNIGYATLSVIPSARGFGKALSGEVDPQLDAAGRSGGSVFSRGLKTAALIGFGALAVGIGAIMKTGIGEVMDASAGNAQLAAGIKSTGNAANVTVKGMNNLASSIQAYSGQTDDSITASQKLLLTFTNIRNEGPDKIFDLATVATANMAAKMGGDASGAAIQLGKALNDPIKGLTGLGRAGVQFTDQQKAAVKALVESGDIMGAQKIILAELETQFGGAAKAAGESLPGQLNKAKRAFEDVSQSIVGALIPIVLPALEKVGGILTVNVIPAVESFVAGFKDGTGAGGTFRDVLTTVGSVLGAVAGFLVQNRDVMLPLLGLLAGVIAAVKIFTIVQAALNVVLALNPISLIVIALAALVAGIVYAYNNFEGFRTLVDAVWQGIQTVVAAVVGWFQTYVMPILSVVFAAISAYVQAMLTVYTYVWNAIWKIVETVVSWFQSYVMPVVSVVWTAISAYVRAMLTVYQTVWTAIQTVVAAVVGWFQTYVMPVISSVISGISTKFELFKLGVGVVWTAVQTAIQTVVSWFVDNVWTKISAAITTIVAGFQTFKNNVKEKWDLFLGLFTGIGAKFTAIGSSIVEGIQSGMSNAWSAFTAWVEDRINSLPEVAKKVLGIASPSKVFAGIGANMVEGLEQGLRSRMPQLAATAGDLNTMMTTSVAARSRAIGSLDMAPAASRAAAVAGARGSTGTEMPAINVRVFVGDRELTDIVDTRIEAADGRSLDYVASGRRF